MRTTIWRVAGYILFGIGLVGILVPVMPTTVFWILAAGCFARSSPAMYRRILAWPSIGASVALFLEHGAIGRRGKIVALGGILTGAVILWLTGPGRVVTIIAAAVFAGSALYIVTRPGEPRRVVRIVRRRDDAARAGRPVDSDDAA